MLDEFRYALRGLRRNPGFALVAVVTLALGMGVNTAVFSILEGLILRPLPIEDPGRVLLVEGHRFVQVSIPDYRDVQRENTTFSALAAYRPTTMAVDRGTGAQQVFGYLVSGNYFETLGLRPALGRFFTDAEDVGRNAAPLAVLSHEAWTSRFGGDPRIVGIDGPHQQPALHRDRRVATGVSRDRGVPAAGHLGAPLDAGPGRRLCLARLARLRKLARRRPAEARREPRPRPWRISIASPDVWRPPIRRRTTGFSSSSVSPVSSAAPAAHPRRRS